MMRSIYTQFLKSKNVVADVHNIRNSITDNESLTLDKMEFLVCIRSDAYDTKNKNQPSSSVYSLEKRLSKDEADYFIPTILSWNDIVKYGHQSGLCRIASNATLYKGKEYQYSEVAVLDSCQLHRVVITVDAISQNGIDWYSLHNGQIIEAAKRGNATFRLPWFAKRNTDALSVVDIDSLSRVDVISNSNGEASFQLGEKIMESEYPEYVAEQNNQIIVCNKGLILRSKHHSIL